MAGQGKVNPNKGKAVKSSWTPLPKNQIKPNRPTVAPKHYVQPKDNTQSRPPLSVLRPPKSTVQPQSMAAAQKALEIAKAATSSVQPQSLAAALHRNPEPTLPKVGFQSPVHVNGVDQPTPNPVVPQQQGVSSLVQQEAPINIPNVDLMSIFDRINPQIAGGYAALQRQLGGAQQQERGDFNNIIDRLHGAFNNSDQTFTGAVGNQNQYVQNFADKMGVGGYVPGAASTGLRNQQDARLGELGDNLRQGMGMTLGTLANARNSMYDTFKAQAGAGGLSALQQLADAVLTEQSKGNLQSSRLAAQAASQGGANQLALLKLQHDMRNDGLDTALKQARLQKLLQSAASGNTTATETMITQNPGLLEDLQGILDPKVKNTALQAYNSTNSPDDAIASLMKASMAPQVDALGNPIDLGANTGMWGAVTNPLNKPLQNDISADALRAAAMEYFRPYAPAHGGTKATESTKKKVTGNGT